MAKRKIEKGAPKANNARRYTLAPTPEIAATLAAWGHTRRAIWNLALAQRQLLWEGRRIPISAMDQNKLFTISRRELGWLEDFPVSAAQEVFRNLDSAYRNWWNPEHPAGPPTREKRKGKLRFSLPAAETDVRHLNRKWSEVWISKIGWVRFRRHRPIGGEVRAVTFTYAPGAGWQVSFGVASKPRVTPINTKSSVGVDFGVACSAFLSDETKPRLMDPTLTVGERRRLLGLERRKARQITWAKRHNAGRYSHRLRHTVDEIARLRARQARRRNDFTHKLTSDLAKNHGIIGVEDLKVKNMTASAKGTVEAPGTSVRAKAGLNRGILDNAPFERRRQLAYKAPRYGAQLVPVPPKNTSRRCSKCKTVDPANRPGCGREFACVSCGHQEHADLNAAKNIEAAAVAKVNAAQTAGPAGTRVHNSTGRRKPSQSRKAEGGSVKRLGRETATRPLHGNSESRVA